MTNKISEKLRKYRTEIVLATSTTFIMAGLYLQHVSIKFLKTNPSLIAKISPFPFLMKMFQNIPFSQMLELGKPAFDREWTVFLLNIFRNPIPQLLLFLILPMITLFIMGEDPKKYGFQIGDYKTGLLITFASLAVMAPLLYWASTMPSFVRYYTAANRGGMLFVIIQFGLYMFSWEYILRGYLYFSLEERMGPLAVWVQSVPFAIAHLGKPPAESLTCYFGGLVLGYLSLKTRSFLYAFLIHWGIYVMLAAFIFMKK